MTVGARLNPVRVSTRRIYTRLGREAGSALHSLGLEHGRAVKFSVLGN